MPMFEDSAGGKDKGVFWGGGILWFWVRLVEPDDGFVVRFAVEIEFPFFSFFGEGVFADDVAAFGAGV